MGKFFADFKKFAMKGNIVDMAVGVIIGGAFGKIVTSLVNDIIMPTVGMLMGGVDFTSLKYVITEANEELGIVEAAIKYGSFIQTIVDFLIIALSVFFFVRLMGKLQRKKEAAPPPAPPKPTLDQELLTEIRDLLKNKND
ncbi:MAG: large-conductance mechanosensitive channel protein MscL [Ruminococcaceae bacterium]|nr:large-conductance mechanosensitive channel protein MscL [Oscillospiraceae bacterium]